MRKSTSTSASKGFRLVYFLTTAVFLIFSTALLARSAELRRGNAFYRRTEKISEAPAGDTALTEAQLLSRQLARFAEKHPDTAIWLRLPDTPLDHPVMLGEDNQFYLDHLPDGRKNALGSLFLDCRTGKDSQHLIVYGHNGPGEAMFGFLKEYGSQDYFLEHRTLTVTTPDSVYLCPIFSVRWVEADSDAYRLEFEDGDLADYMEQAAEDSIYRIDADLGQAEKVLTLSTCSGRGSRRLIVQAMMVQA